MNLPDWSMAKTDFLQIRFSPEDKWRIDQVAASNHLEPSTWARQVLLKAVTEAERNGEDVDK